MSAIRMMMGMGTPRSHKRMERMIASVQVFSRTDESRSRPPSVADKLATNAPTNSEMTSHSARAADALRASNLPSRLVQRHRFAILAFRM